MPSVNECKLHLADARLAITQELRNVDNDALKKQILDLIDKGDLESMHMYGEDALANMLRRSEIRFAKLINDQIRSKAFRASAASRFKNLTSKKAILGAIDAILERPSIVKIRGSVKSDSALAKSFDSMVGENGLTKVEAQRAFNLLDNFRRGGGALQRRLEKLGYDSYEKQLEVYQRLIRDGTFKGDKDLGTIAGALKKHQLAVDELRAGLDPYAKATDIDALTFRPDANQVRKLTEDEFVDFLQQDGMYRHIEFFKKEISRAQENIVAKYRSSTVEQMVEMTTADKVARKWYRDLTESKPGGAKYHSLQASEASADLRFIRGDEASMAAEREFVKRFSSKTNNLLAEHLNHQQKLLENAEVFNIMGSNAAVVEGDIKALATEAAAKGKVAITPEDIDKQIALRMEHLGSRSPIAVDPTSQKSVTALRKFLSAVLTTKSALRNLFLDPITLSTSGRLAMGQGAGEAILETAKIQGQILKQFGRTSKEFEQLADYFIDQGVQIRMHTHLQLAGYETNQQLATQFKSGSGLDALATGAEQTASGLARKLDTWTGADRSYWIAKTIARESQGKIMMKALHRGWGHADNTLLRSALEQAGVNERMFNVWQKVRKEISPWSSKEFDIKAFDELTEADLANVRRGGETLQQTQQRVKAHWDGFMDEIGNDHIASITNRDRLTSYTGSGYAKAVLATSLQFLSINVRTFEGLRRNTFRMIGLNPADPWMSKTTAAAMAGNPKALGAFMTTATAASFMYLWARDLAEGRQPRDITMDNWVEGMMQTGFGGYLAILYSNTRFNDSLFGNTTSGIVRPANRLFKGILEGDAEKTVRGARGLIPFGDMWWTKRGTDLLLDKGMGISPKEKELWYKRYLKEELGTDYREEFLEPLEWPKARWRNK